MMQDAVAGLWPLDRSPTRRAVLALLGGCALLLAACDPGPAPTPTLPPDLDFTVTPEWPAPTPTVTTIPSLTPSQTPRPPTPTREVTQPVATSIALPSPDVIPAATGVMFTIPPRLMIATAIVPTPGAVGSDAFQAGDVAPGALPGVPVNLDFDGGTVEQGAGEVVVPAGWTAWWRSGPVDCDIYVLLQTAGPCPALAELGLAYKRPEFTVIPAAGRWLDPPRVADSGQAARFFCTFGICEGGYWQQVRVTPGRDYSLSALVHAWCTQNGDDPYHSQIDTADDRLNCELALGMDPTGGIDPQGGSIIWQGISAYDTYQAVITPVVKAQASVVTLFLRGRSLWGMRYNDFHFDRVSFSAR
jgi:hypothetical protein